MRWLGQRLDDRARERSTMDRVRLVALLGIPFTALACGEDSTDRGSPPTARPPVETGTQTGEDPGQQEPTPIPTPVPVYLGGLPVGALADGSYTFAVVVPALRDAGWRKAPRAA
jgi:hypothetical protein